MGKRSTGRKLAMQLLYQLDAQKSESDSVKTIFEEQAKFHEDTKEWALTLFEGAAKAQSECDDLIIKYAIGWEIGRINSVDRCILRLAFYELLHTETPFTVVVNEAIELCKRYSTEDSPKFVNGILGNYVKKECLQDSSKA
ncbi:transcription antitermination factor NusB [Candidatus Marinamargulisbacteria bacterium SCGC AAA071-K20]|nr:transcription antitermination factor NusB [Candidatus Marinamargulisbacteria bacterium SCGC AAA071-K20]